MTGKTHALLDEYDIVHYTTTPLEGLKGLSFCGTTMDMTASHHNKGYCQVCTEELDNITRRGRP